MKLSQYQNAFWNFSGSSDDLLLKSLLVILLDSCLLRRALLLSLTQKKTNTIWQIVISIAAPKITQLNLSRYHQYSLIRLLEIRMNETYGLKPCAVPLVYMVHV